MGTQQSQQRLDGIAEQQGDAQREFDDEDGARSAFLNRRCGIGDQHEAKGEETKDDLCNELGCVGPGRWIKELGEVHRSSLGWRRVVPLAWENA